MTNNLNTHSSMQTAKQCLRRHYLAYGRGIRPRRDAIPLRIGQAIHYGLDLYKRDIINHCVVPGEDDCRNIILHVINKYNGTKPSDPNYIYDWEIERAIISSMLSGYFWRWRDANEEFEIVASELAFELPIINPDTGRMSRVSKVAGRIDGIVKLPDGRLAVMEHKTTSDDLLPDSEYWKKLRIDSQISLYFLAAQQSGYNVETILYDVLRKPSIRPYRATPPEKRKYKADGSLYTNQHDKDETPSEYAERFTEDIGIRPDFYFARKEIPRLAADIEEFQYELWQMTKLLHDCEKNHRYPRNTGACIGFGRCPYFELCTNGFDIHSDTIPDNFVKVDDVHPELGTI